MKYFGFFLVGGAVMNIQTVEGQGIALFVGLAMIFFT